MKKFIGEEKRKWKRLSEERFRHELCKKSRGKGVLDKNRAEKHTSENKTRTTVNQDSSQSSSTRKRVSSVRGGFRQPSMPKRARLVAPKNLCLDTSYDEFTNFISKFRLAITESGNNIDIDFLKIQAVTSGAALVFAAELDRWRRTQNVTPRARKINKWNSSVSRAFNEMGLFKLLNVSNPPAPVPDPYGVKIIKFQSLGDQDTKLDPGESAKKFREILESTTGISVAKGHRKAMYRGLSEAMTNVLSHAYEGMNSTTVPYIENAWWVSGDYNQNSKELSVYVYDQGIGIPNSFKTKEKWRDAYEGFKRLFVEHHDGNLIDAAMGSTKTRTGLRHRGKGLRDIRDWIKNNKSGELRIMSGSGELKITPDGQTQITALRRELGGTLIHWRIKIDGET